MAPKKKTGTALVAWEEKFAGLAKATAKGAKVAEGKFLSFKNGLSYAGADIADDEVRCVIVGWVYHNAYYDPDERYDPQNPQSPICYAFADTPPEDGDMEPLDSVPEKQCDNCAECPFNQWESGNGRGKACKNSIRLALIAEEDLEDIDSAEVIYASIPPKSLKNWLKYAVDCRDKHERPLWSVITLLKRVDDSESQFKVEFSHEENIEDSDYFQPLENMWEANQETISFPYQVREASSAPKKGVKGKPAARGKPKVAAPSPKAGNKFGKKK